MEADEKPINYFSMMKRLNLIKEQGLLKKFDPDFKHFFLYIFKTVILIGYDTLTKKRKENKKIDISLKESQITDWKSEIREIESKMGLIQQIKENIKMKKTKEQRRQMASDDENKEKENDIKLIETVSFTH